MFDVIKLKLELIECCGVNTDQVDQQLRFVEAKLLQNLVDLVKKYGSLAQDISLCLWRVRREVELGREVIPKMFSCSYPWQIVSIQSHILDLVRASFP